MFKRFMIGKYFFFKEVINKKERMYNFFVWFELEDRKWIVKSYKCF